MKGSARLIGVDRQGITRHNNELQGRACYAINTKRCRWKSNRADCICCAVILEPIACRWQSFWIFCARLGCCDLRFLSRFLRSLTIALGRELFDTFTVGKPSQKVERRRRRFTALIFIVFCLTHTRSVPQPLHQKSGAHTLELGLPTLTRAGQRKPGVASNSVSSQAWVTLQPHYSQHCVPLHLS